MTNDYSLKIVLIGDFRVGKTSIRRRFLGEHFRSNYLPTVGADFSYCEVSFDDKKLKLLIWDLAGENRFSKVIPIYYKGAYGSIVVFDLTNRDSFLNLANWISEFLTYSKVKNPPFIIIGNKHDLIVEGLEEQAVSDEEVEEFINSLKETSLPGYKEIPYIKTSAKTGENVQEAFIKLSKLIIEHFFDKASVTKTT